MMSSRKESHSKIYLISFENQNSDKEDKIYLTALLISTDFFSNITGRSFRNTQERSVLEIKVKCTEDFSRQNYNREKNTKTKEKSRKKRKSIRQTQRMATKRTHQNDKREKGAVK